VNEPAARASRPNGSSGCTAAAPRGRWHSRAVCQSLAIATVAAERAELEAEHFSPRERDELAGRHVQSLAGRLALKRALCQLLAPEQPGVALAPRDFVIMGSPTGAPVLGPLPATLRDVPEARRGRLFVSITHSKAQAVGLAVQQRALDDRAEPAGDAR
jgi:phosphopantetheinyl transferase (holo-ACP synthase)